MPRLIGLTGYARTGKDTVGGFLVSQHGFQRVSFADKLREVALAADPYVKLSTDPEDDYYARLTRVVDAYGWEGAKAHDDVRRLLQRLGTDAGRNILGENVWVDAALQGLDPDGFYVFTDVRFPNEADAIRDKGGVIWRISRPGYEPINGHASETAMDSYNVDISIVNDRSMEDLAEKVRVCLGG